MKTVTFKPLVQHIASLPEVPDHQIVNEPMLYGASVEFVMDRQEQFPLTVAILRKLATNCAWEDIVYRQSIKGYHPVIDTKMVRLMPGQYPCIPGWHCDGVIRAARGKQPNVDTVNEEVFHFVCSVSSGHNPTTEFYTAPITIDVDEDHVWKSVNKAVEEGLSSHYTDEEAEGDGYSPVVRALNGQIMMFNRATLHRGTAAKGRTHRFFFRLSFYHMPCMNEIRNQVQVYTDIGEGW